MKNLLIQSFALLMTLIIFSDCDKSPESDSQPNDTEQKVAQAHKDQYITPPRLSEPDEMAKPRKSNWYSFIFNLFSKRKDSYLLLKDLDSNANKPDVVLCECRSAFPLPDTEMITINITEDKRIIFDFDFISKKHRGIYIEIDTTAFRSALLEFQLEFLEKGINPPLVFRLDKRVSFAFFDKISKLLREIEMEYMTVIVDDVDLTDNDQISAVEIPLATDPLEIQRNYLMVASSIFNVFIDEFNDTYYFVVPMRGLEKVEDKELYNIFAHYYHEYPTLKTCVSVNPEIPFCRLMQILDEILIVEREILYNIRMLPIEERQEIDYYRLFRLMRIRRTTEWDEYVMDKFRENPDSLEELEDLY
jgi:hypothetical protein